MSSTRRYISRIGEKSIVVTINSITVSGLYSFKKETTINFKNNNLIVGPNNSGKTNIFRIFRFLISVLTNERLSNIRYNKQERFPILKFDIHLSEDEIEDVSHFVMISLVNGATFKNETLHEFFIHFKKLQDFTLELKFADTGSEDIMVNELLLSEKTLGLQIRKGPNVQVITNDSAKHQPVGFDEAIASLNKTKGVTQHNVRPEHLIEFFNEIGNPIILNDIVEPQPPADKLRFTNTKEKFEYASNENVSFFKLLGRIMRSKISYLSEQRRIREPDVMMDTTKLDEDGENLASYLFSLKLNASKAIRKQYSEIDTQFSKILKDEVNFNIIYEEKRILAAENMQGKHLIPKIIFERNGIQFSQDEVGAGIKEILLLLTKSKLEKESLIFMDEPALHIHPIQLKMTLREIIKNITDSKSQLLLISHSVNMPIVEFLEKNNQLIHVKMEENTTNISEPNKEEKEILREIFPRLELDLDVEIFFSKCVILVEGDSEIGIIQGLDKKLEKNIGLMDIHLVSLDSKDNLSTYLTILKMYSIPYVILLDLDALTRIEKGHSSTVLKVFKEVYPKFIEDKIEPFDRAVVDTQTKPKWAQALRDASKDESSEIKKLVEETISKNSHSIKKYKEENYKTLFDKFEKMNVFIIREGDIEDLMKNVDSDLYCRLDSRSKRMNARNFINSLEPSKISKLTILQKVLERSIALASR